MLTAVSDYFCTLGRTLADGWNWFWFTPADPYPLGVIRFFTGLIACWLQLCLLPDMGRFFATGGWIPLDVIQQTVVHGYPFSYLDYFHTPASLVAVQCVALGVLVAFTLGLWTRLTSVLALVVMLSSIHRAPMLTTQVEPIVTMVLFYLCLGPARASWSLDRRIARRAAAGLGSGAVRTDRPAPSFSASLSLRLIQVHLAMLCATMGTSMLMGMGEAPVWWIGAGVWWLATRPESRLADLTGMHGYVVNFWSHAIVVVELAFPILIWVRVARPLLLAIAGLVWLSLGLLTGQMAFALMLLVASLSFCSPEWLRGCAECCCRANPTEVEVQRAA
jgi:hypothetical protein